VVQAAVSTGAYTAGLAGAQAAGLALRISCATPVLGPLGGVLGVGVASAMAGQAAIKCRQAQREGWGRVALGPGALTRGVRVEDVAVDAALGVAAFALLGGRFASVMPSDLSKVGAIAKESVHAAGMQYAGVEKKLELVRFFRRDGCHHCGRRGRGQVIGDHMPPNKHAQEQINEARRRLLGPLLRLPIMRRAAAAVGMHTGPPKQRYYPQCSPCSLKQSSAVRTGRRRLVLHEVLHRGGKSSTWHAAGALIGLRHGGGGSNGEQRSRLFQ